METSYGLISTSRQLGQIISLLWRFISSSENTESLLVLKSILGGGGGV